jgi:spore coat protein U domain-containing protein, fimbrial subunit CupE1/2/3/6
MKIQHFRAIALASLLATGWQPAIAQTATDSFQVSITIADNCTIAADDLDFGSQTSLASLVDADSDITVNCSVGTVYTVSLDQGTNVTRLMSDGSNTVDYELYTAALRLVAWGTNVGVDTVGGIGDGTDQTLTVYGRVPAQATPAPSTYVDSVMATIAF